MVVVEVRQGTLGVDGHGWGPAGHTDVDGRGWGPAENTVDRGSQLDEEEEKEDEKREEKEEDEDEEDEEEATDIKSNNPHLAVGEKNMDITMFCWCSTWWLPCFHHHNNRWFLASFFLGHQERTGLGIRVDA